MRRREPKYGLLDDESLMHLSAGMVAGASSMDVRTFALLYGGFEICEQYVYRRASGGNADESLTNMYVDIASATGAFLLMNEIRKGTFRRSGRRKKKSR
tara:strand:- start:251 stop:547 length:297 start_codon:yes stop_codon:yes gene_type:complete